MPWERDQEFQEEQNRTHLQQHTVGSDLFRLRLQLLLVLLFGIVVGASGTSVLWYHQFELLQTTTSYQLATLQAQQRTQLAAQAAQLRTSLAAFQAQQQLTTEFQAIVEHHHATFVFPIPERSLWEWNRSQTAADQQEYGWYVRVPETDSSYYQIGFTQWKFGSAKPSAGSLQELLRSGQSNLWKSDGTNGTMINTVDVTTELVGKQLIVHITGDDVIRQIFTQQTPIVQFTIHTPYERERQQIVPITFVN
jgi:hypothetical protein